jgi:hypothetical protein
VKRPTSKTRQRLLAAVGVLMPGTIAGLLGVKNEIGDLWFEQITLRRSSRRISLRMCARPRPSGRSSPETAMKSRLTPARAPKSTPVR